MRAALSLLSLAAAASARRGPTHGGVRRLHADGFPSTGSFELPALADSVSNITPQPPVLAQRTELLAPRSGSNISHTPVNLTSPQFFTYFSSSQTGNPPAASSIKADGDTILALTFWGGTGLSGNAATWAAMSASDRESILESYHANGVKLVVSAFGSAETPTTSGEDAVTVATNLAKFVLDYNLDGCDVDYEDFNAMRAGTAVEWVIQFQTQLRNYLGTGYIITHAPIAPWFTDDSSFGYAGGYRKIDQEVGSTINLYLVQYYNQGDYYTTCEQIVTESQYWTGSALLQIIAAGVPANKLLIGKPATSADASSGYTAPSTLKTCVQEAQQQGWEGGLMTWAWPDSKGFRAEAWP